MGVSLNGGTPQNTPKWSFLVGKPMVVGYHHCRKPPYWKPFPAIILGIPPFVKTAGVGIVKLMGRDSGFVAMHAATAADVVDLCMIPEVKVDMKEMQLRKKLGGGLKYFSFHPYLRNDPIWLIFFNWVETTNQKTCFVMMEFCWDMFVASCSFVTCFFLIFKPVLVEG